MSLRARVLLWLGVSMVLFAVFAAYLQPDLAYTLANQLWSCF